MFKWILITLCALPLLGKTSYDQERQEILEIFAAEWFSHAIHAAAHLELADQLDSGPRSIEELAKATGTHPESLYRLMHTLASRGIFRETKEGLFSHTTTSLLLTRSHPETLRNLILFYGSVVHPSWQGLVASVKTGKPGFELVHGKSVFEQFNKEPATRTLFHKAMEEKSKAVIKSSILAYDFSRFKKVFDIGGGNGHFLWAVMESNPATEGTLFDLPEVTLGARIPSADFEKRAQIVGGNFFREIPKGGDIYLLKSILHDWNDENAMKILSSCRQAMGPESRLLIIEPVMLPANEKDYTKLMDILMMNVTGGRERSVEDFRTLLTASGFELMGVYPTSTEFRLLEAR